MDNGMIIWQATNHLQRTMIPSARANGLSSAISETGEKCKNKNRSHFTHHQLTTASATASATAASTMMNIMRATIIDLICDKLSTVPSQSPISFQNPRIQTGICAIAARTRSVFLLSFFPFACRFVAAVTCGTPMKFLTILYQHVFLLFFRHHRNLRQKGPPLHFVQKSISLAAPVARCSRRENFIIRAASLI